ncbi:MAG: hypothetical protein JRH01_07160 [Deltaproteobacteria bacterium]|nr:hypothetical protein [Deltaproteobacteria bacterium]MBW2394903.1 hypothetical protein [Deltaproteobacteria bacterium]
MSERPIRILIVEAAPPPEGYDEALGTAGFAVVRASSLDPALELLCDGAFDVAVLSHPLPGSDLIAGCAALRASPGAPSLVLLDATGQSAELERLIPAAMQPSLVLPHPVDSVKLAAELRTLLDHPAPHPQRRPDASLVLSRVVLELHRSRATGVLDVRGEGRRTFIRFTDGRVVMAEGGSLRESLGRILLRKGELSDEDYVRVIERMTERVYEHEPVRMGEVLVELGLFTPEEVFGALREQLSEKIVASFRTYVSHEFREEEPETEVGGFGLPQVEAIVALALSTYLPESEARAAVEARVTGRPTLAAPPTTVAARLELDGVLAEQLGAVNGERSVAQLLEAADPRLLITLEMTGQLVVAQPQPRPKARAKGPAPRPRQIPKKRERPHEPSEQEQAGARLEAERAFRLGQEHLEADRIGEARTSFARAVALEPLEAEYHMYESWAAYMVARVEVRVQRAKLTACARKVVEEDNTAARPHTILGRLALEEENRMLARTEFQLALLRDPEDREARSGIERLDRQATGD